MPYDLLIGRAAGEVQGEGGHALRQGPPRPEPKQKKAKPHVNRYYSHTFNNTYQTQQ